MSFSNGVIVGVPDASRCARTVQLPDDGTARLAKGPITASGRLGEDRSVLLERLDADGRVEFPIDVELTDEDGTTVARMTVDWHVRRNS